MSFLTPLYALGALAIAAPIIFHLIRRTPTGEVSFSSLMFLEPSPPRLSKRSRLDQVLLLLLRAIALILLAIAFARPFLRASDRIVSTESVGERRRVALLIDTSASMRRGDLWARSRVLADEVVSGIRPGDQLAIHAFDAVSRTVLGFAESATLDPGRRLAVARARLDALRPSWGSTQLGQALVDVVSAVSDVAESSEKSGNLTRRVILIGDLQRGSRTDALGEFEWPSDVELELKPVTETASNAGIFGLANSADAEAPEPGVDESIRVRVGNESGDRDSFTLVWTNQDGSSSPGEIPISAHVPPGESRVVRVPRPKGTPAKAPASAKLPTRLVLRGDQRDFDNTLHLAERSREEVIVRYLGKDAGREEDDPSGLLYYVRRAFVDTPRRTVKVEASTPDSVVGWPPAHPPSLVIVGGETTDYNIGKLRSYARDGGTLLVVLDAPGKAGTLAGLAEVPPFDLTEAHVGRDVILGQIAFDHRIFAPFAAPQFNDFTKIHFWKYRKLAPGKLGDDSRVLAQFESGDPAFLEKPIGKGRLFVLTSGWNSADSQLARSSKFVPILMSLTERNGSGPLVGENFLVGDRIPIPSLIAGDRTKPPSIRKPDGSRVVAASTDTTFSGTDLPGVYTLETSTGNWPFAVNLDPLESRVAPLDVETLEQLGCRLSKATREQPDPDRIRQLRNAELEGRQKLWRWLILAALAFLIAETWLSGRLSRPGARTDFQPAPAEAATS
jgi:hypothetical protein